LVGCGKDDDAGGGNIVCGDGEAWIVTGGNNTWDWDELGYVFKGNGDLVFIYENGGIWRIDIYDPDSYTYSTSGNKLTMMDSDGYEETFTYNVSGNTLTVYLNDGGNVVFTKRSGLNIQMSKSREGNEKSPRSLFKN
jgi:hypothetical protein